MLWLRGNATVTPAGQRFFLVSATLGAFAVGTLTGALATFGPGADMGPLAQVEPSADARPQLPSDAQRIVLAAEVEGQASPAAPSSDASGTGKSALTSREGRGQIMLGEGKPDIAPTASVLADLKATVQDNPVLSSDRLETDPKTMSDVEIASIATVAKAALTPRPWKSRRVEVRKGDSLTTILKRAGIDGQQVHSALRSLKGVYDPRGLRVGQELVVTAATRDDQPAQLLSIALDLSFDHQLLITRDAAGDFSTKKIEQAKRRELVHRSGDIKDSSICRLDAPRFRTASPIA